MNTLLQLNTSMYSSDGQSTRLADQFTAGWLAQHPHGRVVVRDLARDLVPHLTAERFQAFNTKPAERTLEQQAVVAYSDKLIDELRQADLIVLGLPMYNFGVPSTLKAYFDHIARAGVTFSYTSNGAQGLLTGKRVVVFTARGGVYAGTALDTETAYVRDFLRFVGLSDVEFVYAEGLAISASSKEAALAQASTAIGRLHDAARAAA